MRKLPHRWLIRVIPPTFPSHVRRIHSEPPRKQKARRASRPAIADISSEIRSRSRDGRNDTVGDAADVGILHISNNNCAVAIDSDTYPRSPGKCGRGEGKSCISILEQQQLEGNAPWGFPSFARLAGPLSPELPVTRGVPASRLMMPLADIRRTIALPESATRTPPAPSEASPHGALRLARLEEPPSPKYAAVPFPAHVTTAETTTG